MAKETKLQQREREALERANRETYERETYLSRLMALLERAQKVNFEIFVNDGSFVLSDRDERDPDPHVVLPTYEANLAHYEWETGFSILDRIVTSKEAQVTEANRVYALKQAALAKLTKEERALLNL